VQPHEIRGSTPNNQLIDYAIASVEQGKLAVFDAVSARLDANEAARVA